MSSETIREFAVKAKLLSENEAEWFAIDTQGTVWAYKEKPVIKSEACTVWDISDLKHSCWKIGYTAAPDNFRDELYEISQILELSKNMANSPKYMDNSTELKDLARTARNVVAEEAQYITIDANGEVWAFDFNPYIDENLRRWDNDPPGGCWQIGAVARLWILRKKFTKLINFWKMTTKEELKQLAELAASQGLHWIAQDDTGVWYGYRTKPEFRKQSQDWHTPGNNGWAALNLPDNTDYSKQIFNVKKILNNE